MRVQLELPISGVDWNFSIKFVRPLSMKLILKRAKFHRVSPETLLKNESISIFYEYLSWGSCSFETAHLENAPCGWVDISALTHPDQLLATLLFFDLNIGLSEKLKIVWYGQCGAFSDTFTPSELITRTRVSWGNSDHFTKKSSFSLSISVVLRWKIGIFGPWVAQSVSYRSM